MRLRFKAVAAIILSALMLPFSALAQMSDPIAEANAALDNLFYGRYDTHFSLPIEQPMLYAMAFEISDELVARCPGLFPDDFQGIRDIMWPAYVHYVFENREIVKVPPGTSLIEGVAYLIAQSGEGAYPAHARRNALRQLGTATLADELVAVMGGCASPTLNKVAAGLYAAGTFGRLPHHEFHSNFVRQEITENGIGFVCTYDVDPSDSTVDTQGYKRISMLNVADQSPLGQYFRALMDVAYGDQQLGTEPQIPFMRADCPLTPDPRFNLISVFAAPEVPSGTENLSVPEQFAAYFIDAYLPQARKRFDPATLKPIPDQFIAELRDEIIKFETSPLDILDQNGREEAYKANHGNRLYRLSEEGNAIGVDRYLFVRYLVLEELGF